MKGLRRLDCFVAVAEELHFRKAGARLNLTQPALSKHIRELEIEVGARLFDRDRRSVSLTDAGRALLPAAEVALTALRDARARIAEIAAREGSRLRIGYIEFLNAPFLAPTLKEMQVRAPDIIVDQLEIHPNAAQDAVMDGSIDLGLAFLPVRHQDLAFRLALQGEWMVAMPDTHPLTAHDALTAEDVADEDLVLFAKRLNPRLYDDLVRQLSATGNALRIRHTVSQALSGPKYVQEGLGLFVHASYVLDALPSGLVRRPIAGLPPLELGLVWRPDRRTPAVTAFLDAMRVVTQAETATTP